MSNKKSKKKPNKMSYIYESKESKFIVGVDLAKGEGRTGEIEYYLNVPYLEQLTRDEN